MATPCFEDDVTKNSPHYDPEKEKMFWDGNKLVVTPEVSKAFYKEAKAKSDLGMTFPEILDDMERTRGLRRETIAAILKADKTATRMTDEVWYRQAKYREVKSAAERLIINANIPKGLKWAGDFYNFSRALETMYHGGVIPFSHAFGMLVTPGGISRRLLPGGESWWGQRAKYEGGIWLGIVKDAYRYAPFPFHTPSPETMAALRRGDWKEAMKTAGRGEAAWAKDMAEMVGSPDWIDAVRHKVEAHPADAPVGILENIAKGWGVRTFDALKKGRVKLYQLRKAQLKEYDDHTLNVLGHEVNVSTGTLKMSEQQARIGGILGFAPKVWVTRRLDAFTPIRYGLKLGRMGQEERGLMNQSLARWARHVATAAAVLEANDQFNLHFTKSKQRVNFFDWTHPGTLWRMNIGGYIVPLSPLVEVARAPVAAAGVMLLTRRETRGATGPSAAMLILGKEVLNALHPSIIHMIELWQGREVFGVPHHERRLPFPGVKQLLRGEEPERDAPLSYTEYLGEGFGPIPMQDAVKELFSPALTQETGIPRSEADKWVMALFSGGLSATTGKHIWEQSPMAPAQPTRKKQPPGTLRPPGSGQRRPGTLKPPFQ